jgi:hypothetical protein
VASPPFFRSGSCAPPFLDTFLVIDKSFETNGRRLRVELSATGRQPLGCPSCTSSRQFYESNLPISAGSCLGSHTVSGFAHLSEGMLPRCRTWRASTTSLLIHLQPLLRPVLNSFFGYEHFPSAGCAPHPCFSRIDQHRISLPKECSHRLSRHVRFTAGSSTANLVNKPQPSESERGVG